MPRPTGSFQNMHDPADHAPIVRSLDTTHICGQLRRNRAHCSSLSQNRFLRMTLIPLQKSNQDCIVGA